MGICPICKQDNGCAIDQGKDPKTCWCMRVEISESLLKEIREEGYNACLCSRCFKSKILVKSSKSD